MTLPFAHKAPRTVAMMIIRHTAPIADPPLIHRHRLAAMLTRMRTITCMHGGVR